MATLELKGVTVQFGESHLAIDTNRGSPYNHIWETFATLKHILFSFATNDRNQRKEPSPERHALIRLAKAKFGNDPSAGSPTETLLRLLLPLNDQV